MYQTIYEIPDKLVSSTFFNALFYVLVVCTVLMALSWINFNKDKTFWKCVVVLFNLMVVALWVVHIVVVNDIKTQYVDAYKQGEYLTIEGVIEDYSFSEESDSFSVAYSENGVPSALGFTFPHNSGYGYKGEAELKNGDKVIIYYVIDNSMSYDKKSDLKCIVKIDKWVEAQQP